MFEKPKNMESKEKPSFDEMREALPENLRDEFDVLGNIVFELSEGAEGGKKQAYLDGSEEEQQVDEYNQEEKEKLSSRYRKLEEIAKENMKEK